MMLALRPFVTLYLLIPTQSPATHSHRSYAFPSLIKLMPAPLLQAARATVEGGRAARQWIEKQRAEDEDGGKRRA